MDVSKAALKHKIKMLINTLGVTPSLKDSEHFDFFKQVIARHPECPKWGEPSDIGIRKNVLYRSTEVFGVWPSGTYPVSMEKCINMKLPSTRAELYEAMRNSIDDQIMAYRASCDEHVCVFCQSTSMIEVDHIVLFSDLVKQFLVDKETPTSFGRNRGSAVVLKPGSFCDEWRAFHGNTATFRLLCRGCNGARNIKKTAAASSEQPPSAETPSSSEPSGAGLDGPL